MQTQKYSVNQHLIETLLTWVKSGEIAIPEIQRPFVWDSTKVRDLMDSLYEGYPIGYVIAWRNPNVRLKDGTLSEGKKVLIDGQQRVTALTAAILGQQVINKDYKKVRIIISFHPLEQRFEVFNTAIQKDAAWIHDIAPIISGDERVSKIVKEYCEKNPHAIQDQVEDALENLKSILKKQIGLIELNGELNIETVTEIFIRINSKGVVLSQADFAMSKIASNEIYGGNTLRKCIDYFCHLAVAPEFYSHISEVDKEFFNTEYFNKISWLKNENDDLYDPSYSDLLRVAFTSEFNRGKLSDLVSLLSGRNFEKKIFEEEIAEQSFQKLKNGVLNFINETHFKRFIMIVKSAGFIDADLISSQNAINFAYIVYLKLRAEKVNDAEIESAVRKWLVLSLLTGRYSGSPESTFDFDIRNIANGNFKKYLSEVESAELSDGFWNAGLVQQLNSPLTTNPSYNVYLAALCKFNNKGFLSKDITVKDLIQHKGDIHHLFPKDYLKKNGITKSQYNQVANYVYMQSEINIKIGNRSPKDYFDILQEQCNGNGSELKFGGINTIEKLKTNLHENDIPELIMDMTVENYNDFLDLRRKRIAEKLKQYYDTL
jgi:hypothetical protein